MQHLATLRSLFLGSLVLTACALDPSVDDLDDSTSELRLDATVRLEAGTGLVALGVTSDDHALYWGQGAVWAKRLRVDAPARRLVAAAAPPLTLIVGKVAMIWTDQPVLGAPAPSALTVWSSATGAVHASDASLPPALSFITASSAISPDGREVVFTTNVSPDGGTGDVVRASLDLAHVTTLVAGAQVSPFGPCAPHVGFDQERACGDRAGVVISACAGGDEATLARWVGDHHQVLASVAPGSAWSSDAEGERIYARRADGTSAIWDRAGNETVIETRPHLGWMNRDGSITAEVLTGPGSLALLRTGRNNTTTKIMDLPGSLGFMFANHVAPGIPYYNLTARPTSQDGTVIGAWSTQDPTTGLTDAIRIDTTTATVHTVRATPDAVPNVELTTRDGAYMLFYVFEADGGNTLLAAGRDGSTHALSTANTAFEHYGLGGSVLAFSDRAAGDPSDLLSTTDLVVDDLATAIPGRTVARGVHQLYFPTADRRSLVYTYDGPGGSGLFLTRVR